MPSWTEAEWASVTHREVARVHAAIVESARRGEDSENGVGPRCFPACEGIHQEVRQRDIQALRQLDIGKQGPKRARIRIEPGHDAIERGQAGNEEYCHAIGQKHGEVEIGDDSRTGISCAEPHTKGIAGAKRRLVEAESPTGWGWYGWGGNGVAASILSGWARSS
jgi:hypothetical protein